MENNSFSKPYHKEVFWPKGKFAALQGRTLPLRYGTHALRAAVTDRYGVVQLPKEITFDEANEFEMELDGPWVSKVVLRQPYNEAYDLVLVVIPSIGTTTCRRTCSKSFAGPSIRESSSP